LDTSFHPFPLVPPPIDSRSKFVSCSQRVFLNSDGPTIPYHFTPLTSPHRLRRAMCKTRKNMCFCPHGSRLVTGIVFCPFALNRTGPYESSSWLATPRSLSLDSLLRLFGLPFPLRDGGVRWFFSFSESPSKSLFSEDALLTQFARPDEPSSVVPFFVPGWSFMLYLRPLACSSPNFSNPVPPRDPNSSFPVPY